MTALGNGKGSLGERWVSPVGWAYPLLLHLFL